MGVGGSRVGVTSRSSAAGRGSVEYCDWISLGTGEFFAIPTIALTGASPLATARQSLRLVRRRWGDAVYSTAYLWVRAVVVFGLPATVATIAGVLLIRGDRVIIGGALFAAGVAGLALAYLLAPPRGRCGRRALSVRRSGTEYDASGERLSACLRGPLEHRPPLGPADRGRTHTAAARRGRRHRRAALT